MELNLHTTKAKLVRNLSIIIPYRETPLRLQEIFLDIKELLQQEPYYNTSILLFDDASTNPIPSKNIPDTIQYFRNEENVGYGAIQKKAFDYVLSSEDTDIVVLLHGDNQYHLQDLLRLAASMEHHDFGLLNRMSLRPQNNYPYPRMLSNYILTTALNRTMKTHFCDLHSGGRVYTTDILRQMPYNDFDDHFLFDQQILLHLINNNASGIEYPIQADYSKGSSSISYKDGFKYALQCLQQIWILS